MKSDIARMAAGMLALAIVSSPGAVFAAEPFSPGAQASVVVRYADRDFARPDGAAKLYRRIQAAADQVCGPRVSPGTLWESPAYRQCFNAAVERGVAQVHQPALTALHEQQRAHSAS